MNEIYDADLIGTMPFSISQDEEVERVAKAVETNLNLTAKLIPLVAVYARIDELPEEILDSLAWQFHMDIYDDGADIETKRNSVKTAIQYHRYKGTAWAVKEAAGAVSKNAEVKEWFDYGGEPYHFKAIAENPITLEELRLFMQSIMDAKNVRSWLDGIEYKTASTYQIFALTCEYDREVLTKEIELVSDGEAPIYVGIASAWTKTIDIKAAAFSGGASGSVKGYVTCGVYERDVLTWDIEPATQRKTLFCVVGGEYDREVLRGS